MLSINYETGSAKDLNGDLLIWAGNFFHQLNYICCNLLTTFSVNTDSIFYLAPAISKPELLQIGEKSR